MKWILLVLLYGLLKGSREIAKKCAMQKNSVMEVLVISTLLSFVFVIPEAPSAGGLEFKYYFFIAIKSLCIFTAWIFSFNAIKNLPLSLIGILDLSRVMFATFCGLFFLGERLNVYQTFGLIAVCSGLLLLKFKPPFLERFFSGTKTQPAATPAAEKINSSTKDKSALYVTLALASCLLNAVSGFLDKVLMKDITQPQLQFWYMIFLVLYYFIYILITREKINKSVWKNIWVWLLAIMFVIGDKALFIANGIPESRITVMTLIKQIGCIVTILGGKFIFKEKNIGYKLFCAAVIILGIVLGVMK